MEQTLLQSCIQNSRNTGHGYLWFRYLAPVTLKSRAALIGMPRLQKIRSWAMIGVGMLSHSAMDSVKRHAC
jgi:hypothetical protein